MSTQINLTENELSLLTKIANGLYAEFGYSDMDLNEISDNVKRDRGVLASLIKKGIVYVQEDRIKHGDPSNFDAIHVETEYIFAVREITGKDLWSDFDEDHWAWIEQSQI